MNKASRALLKHRAKKRILVIGDVMIDEYIHGTAERISPEAPTPVLQLTKIDHVLGGAANAAANISAIGATAVLAGVIGNDVNSQKMLELTSCAGIQNFFIRDSTRLTTTKTRVVAQGQQIVRYDAETTGQITSNTESLLIQKITNAFPGIDAVLLSDYAKGVLTPRICEHTTGLCQIHTVPLVVDPKGNDFSKYRNATVITPNLKEAIIASGFRDSDVDTKVMAEELSKKSGVSIIVITRGPDGVDLHSTDLHSHFPSTAAKVFDVTGAGDTLAAGLTIGLACGAPIECSVDFANRLAGISVSKPGTSIVDYTELE